MVDCAIQEWGDFGFDRRLEMLLGWRNGRKETNNDY